MKSFDYPLGNNFFSCVDEEDLPLLRQYKWMLVRSKKKCYAAFDKWNGKKTIRTYMHRFLMGVHGASTPLVDHIDGDGLNNCRSNLRLATHGMNTQNVRTHRKYRGVFKQGNGYIVRAGKNYAGFFENETAAALAYDELVIGVYGPHAMVNFSSMIGTPWITSRFLSVL